ncbi:MAG TPA: hypothetical protein DD435_03030 [Cyanobacteria bacterium UBA8530]|nr:hypothetical protein [Cyanobacteria bacterium UBA8530]
MISEGSLQDFSFSDLLQIISLNGSTGTLKFASEGREASVECRQGEIIGATAGGVQSDEAVYVLFSWERGRFNFLANHSEGPVNIKTPLADLTKEGIRRLDQWRQIKREMPGISAGTCFVRSGSELPPDASAAAAEIHQSLESEQSLSKLAEECSMGELNVAQALLELWNAGAVEMHHTPEEASRHLFKRLSEGLFERFASISGLKMTEGLESLLNNLARENETELRWRNGKVHDGLSLGLSGEELISIFKRFVDAEMDYIQRIYPANFSQRALSEIAEGMSLEERKAWEKLDLPLSPLGVHS